jgi:predicted RNA-binding Zn-ribbon protein involved in translation (DUF1610 family)
MDLASIASAYQGLKSAKDILGVVFDAKVDAGAKEKISEALLKMGEAQDMLFALREELFRLQDSNNQLKNELAESQSWQRTANSYELAKTTGGAVVFKFKGEPEHFACPSCFNKKQVHILQTNRTMSGKYRCTGCTAEFPIEPQKAAPAVNPVPTHNHWGG